MYVSAVVIFLVLWLLAMALVILAQWLIVLYFHKRICHERGLRTNWKGDILP